MTYSRHGDWLYHRLTRKQLAFILARQGIFFETEDEAISDILRNNKLSDYFLALAADLDVMEPKTADDIYKTHLDPRTSTHLPACFGLSRSIGALGAG